MNWYGDDTPSEDGVSSTHKYGSSRTTLLDLGDSYVARINVKNLEEDSIRVRYADKQVFISALPLEEESSSPSNSAYRVRRNWTFHVGDAPPSAIEAELNNGCLIVSIPKGHKNKNIPVTKIS